MGDSRRCLGYDTGCLIVKRGIVELQQIVTDGRGRCVALFWLFRAKLMNNRFKRVWLLCG